MRYAVGMGDTGESHRDGRERVRLREKDSLSVTEYSTQTGWQQATKGFKKVNSLHFVLEAMGSH